MLSHRTVVTVLSLLSCLLAAMLGYHHWSNDLVLDSERTLTNGQAYPLPEHSTVQHTVTSDQILQIDSADLEVLREQTTDPEVLQALSSDPNESAMGIAALRTRGPAGLEALFALRSAYQTSLDGEETLPTIPPAATSQSSQETRSPHSAQPPLEASNLHPYIQTFPPTTPDPTLEYLDDLIAQVGGQLECHASRLYWYTDFAEAQAASRASQKPILSLRLLGELTDVYSCANSRFFRATLYSNAEIAAKLREHFILHWETVGPVPIVTIDFGDGRVIRRTVTGNSAHYLLDADGRPLDVLPGLYSPTAYSQWLDQALDLYTQWTAPEGSWTTPYGTHRSAFLADYHNQKLSEVLGKISNDLAAIDLDYHETSLESFDRWEELAALHLSEVEFDQASRAVIAQHPPTATEAAPLAMSKQVLESPLVGMIRNLQQTVALDTVLNEYLLHFKIHHWFAGDRDEADTISALLPQETEGDIIAQALSRRSLRIHRQAVRNRQVLNDRVYAQLFLTPLEDEWRGLIPPGTFTALPNVTEPNETSPPQLQQ